MYHLTEARKPLMSSSFTASTLFWACVYVLERNLQHFFLYGYAIQTASPRSRLSKWRSGEVDVRPSERWILRRYNRFATEGELTAWAAQLTGPTVDLAMAPGVTITVITDGLVRRPPVFSAPAGDLDAGPVRSLTNQLGVVETYWRLDKDALVRAVFPELQGAPASLASSLGHVIEQVEKETGLELRAKDVASLGNFEIKRFLTGAYELSDGLGIAFGGPDAADDFDRQLSVWIESPLSNIAAGTTLMVGCQLFNGGGGSTCILDEIRRWPPSSGEHVLRFTAAEPVARYEVAVWHLPGGAVVARQQLNRLRVVGLNASFG